MTFKRPSGVKEIVKDNKYISILTSLAFVYYIVSALINKPWYDELYTYYTFISRGPIYSAIHWPFPNNHIGYSVLSSCLNIFGSSFISLRGVSILAATANIVLIYCVMKEFVSRELATISAILYICAGEVNKLAIQGRGYTLATTCLLIALFNLIKIIKADSDKRRHFILFAIALTYGLYVLPSSVYWVLPICVSGGVYLLLQKKYKRLNKLILYALGAAFVTFMLYTLVWLATGANYISKDPTTAFYGMNQASIVLKAPFLSWKRGFVAMMDNQFIQPIERSTVISSLFIYFKTDIFHRYFTDCGLAIIIIMGIALLYNIFATIRDKSAKRFLHIYIIANIVLLPIILIVQSVLPFTRVLSYFMLIVSMATVSLIDGIGMAVKGINFKKFSVVSYLLIACAMAYLIVNNENVASADRETQIYELLKPYDASSLQGIFITDEYQRLVIKYYFGETPEEKAFENADVLLIYDGQITDYEWTPWPELILFNEERMAYVKDNYTLENRFGSYSMWRLKSGSRVD